MCRLRCAAKLPGELINPGGIHMPVLFRTLRALSCAALILAPAIGQAQDLFRLVAIDALVATDPPAALAEVDAALRDPNAVGTPPDLRVMLDLLKLRAELLEQLGDTRAAADAWSQLARTQAFSRKDLGDDPVPSYEKAAALYEVSGSVGQARGVMHAAIAAETETGREGEVLLRLYENLLRLAELSGDEETAATARAILQQMNAPSLEFSDNESGGYVPIDVFYATDRARTGSRDPADFYSGNRADRLELGIVTVTIPDTHQAGQVERPSVWKLEFSPSPSRHILLKSIEPMNADTFFGRMQREFSGAQERDLFVYIHGFNHDFEYAAQRAAQLTYDMGSSAVPVLFSWPSRNTTMGYISDTAAVRVSGRRLAVFLEDLVAESGATTVHVLAHSMGSRALTDALEIMALTRDAEIGDPPVFGQVMFAAPDVDAQLFSKMAQVFRPLSRRLTLYASSNDWALVSSRKLHGSAPRAGLGGDVLLADKSFDSVDMTALGEDMLAHNYFSNDSSALADMMTLFWTDTPPERRCGLTSRETRFGRVWEYRKGICPSNDLVGIIANARQENVQSLGEIRALVPALLPEQRRADGVMSAIDRILAGG